MGSDGGRSQDSTETTTKEALKDIEFKREKSLRNNVFNEQKFFEKRICTIKDVSLFTGYSVGTLYNLTSQDLIPHRKKRGRLFFVPTEILNWIDEGDI
jgi:predicted DNA-binding transcriptional regulator AlpA